MEIIYEIVLCSLGMAPECELRMRVRKKIIEFSAFQSENRTLNLEFENVMPCMSLVDYYYI